MSDFQSLISQNFPSLLVQDYQGNEAQDLTEETLEEELPAEEEPPPEEEEE